MSKLPFTVQQATRQLGCSQATVRTWISKGMLETVTGSKPLLLDRESVLRARAKHLAEIDGVLDLHADDGQLSASTHLEAETARLRQQLRAVIASLESFDEGVNSLRTAQRILLENLLGEFQDVRPIET